MATPIEAFERSFAVGESGELVLSNIAGSVEIRGWDYPEIRISGVKRAGGFLPWASAEEGFRATRIEMEQRGSRVVVRTARRSAGFWSFLQWLGGIAQVDYTARVPRHCNVVVDLVSGRLTLEELRGNVIARTVSAEQTLRDLEGNLVVSGVSGSVVGEGLRGKAAFRTVSGGVKVHLSHFTSLSGRTVSGELSVETPLAPSGVYDFESVSGSVRLRLPEGAACSAELQSLSGWARSELPGSLRELRRGYWRAEVGGGGPRVRMKSVSGGLRLARAEGARILGLGAAEPAAGEPAAAEPVTAEPAGATPPAAAADSTTPGPPGSAEREEIMTLILGAVERGELSVDEAAAKLAELDALARDGGSPPGSPGESAGAAEPSGEEGGAGDGR